MRQFKSVGFCLCVAILALSAATRSYAAYPERPIRFVVPFGPGGTADVLARYLGQKMSEKLGTPVVIENRPGGSSIIGAQSVINAAPDGYSLLIGTTATSLLSLRKSGSPIDMRRDLKPITSLAETTYVILASADTPFNSISELIAYAKQNAGKINAGVFGVGTSSHLLAEYFSARAGIKVLTVPYNGAGPQSIALLSGEIQIAFDGIGVTNAHVRAGRLKLLATTGLKRSQIFPDTPTVAQTIPGFTASGLYGLLTTPGTPKEIVDKLSAVVNEISATPEFRERLLGLSLEGVSSTPEEYGRMIASDTEKWGEIARISGVVIE